MSIFDVLRPTQRASRTERPETPQLSSEWRVKLEALAANGERLALLPPTPAFQRFEAALKQRYAAMNDKLVHGQDMDLHAFQTLQTRLNELEFVLNVVPSAIEDGRVAREQLRAGQR